MKVLNPAEWRLLERSQPTIAESNILNSTRSRTETEIQFCAPRAEKTLKANPVP